MPENIKSNLNIVTVKEVDDVLKKALTEKLEPVSWTEMDTKEKNPNQLTAPH